MKFILLFIVVNPGYQFAMHLLLTGAMAPAPDGGYGFAMLGPKQNICLFPICCHFNQWVGRKFILFFVTLTKSVGKNYFLVYLGPDSLPCMSYLYIT